MTDNTTPVKEIKIPVADPNDPYAIPAAMPSSVDHAVRSFNAGDYPEPSRKQDEWRYTPIERINEFFTVFKPSGETQIEVSMIDGSPLAEGVKLSQIKLGEGLSGTVSKPNDRVSAVEWESGRTATILELSGEIAQPVLVKVHGAGEDLDAFHLVIAAADKAHADVVVEHDGDARLAEGVEITTGKDSHVSTTFVQEWAKTAKHVANHRIHVGEGASLRHSVVTLGGDIVRSKNFRYTSTLRLSHNKTKIKSMGDDGFFLDEVKFPSPGNPGTAVRLQNGLELGQYFIYKYAGLDENGKWLIYDKNNEIVPATDGSTSNLVAENKHFVGNAIPKVILSWDHTFKYKNWDLSIFLRSWLGYDVFSQVNMYYGLANDSQLNVLKSAYTRNRNIKDEKILCDYWLDDGSFLKIDAINLGYTFNLRKWTRYIQSAKLYLTIRDVAVFTDYNGLNPEVNINGLYPGFEYVNDTSTMYPQTTRFTLGVQLNF